MEQQVTVMAAVLLLLLRFALCQPGIATVGSREGRDWNVGVWGGLGTEAEPALR